MRATGRGGDCGAIALVFCPAENHLRSAEFVHISNFLAISTTWLLQFAGWLGWARYTQMTREAPCNGTNPTRNSTLISGAIALFQTNPTRRANLGRDARRGIDGECQ
jgi:hypothetical protein